MSPRSLAAVLALGALTACDHEERGPLQTRDNVFAYHLVTDTSQTVHVRTMRGDISVRPSPDDTLRVTASFAWRGDQDPTRGIELSGRQEGSDVLICAVWGRGTCTADRYDSQMKMGDRSAVSNAAVHFTLQVPAGVRLNLVGIDGEITSASSAPVYARTVNGDVTVVTARGPVQAETMNGDVDARMTSLVGTDSVVVKTLNGDAWAFLPETAGATLDMSVTSGELDSDFPALRDAVGDRRSLQAILGDGRTPVRVRTLNGTAGLRRLDAEGRSYPD